MLPAPGLRLDPAGTRLALFRKGPAEISGGSGIRRTVSPGGGRAGAVRIIRRVLVGPGDLGRIPHGSSRPKIGACRSAQDLSCLRPFHHPERHGGRGSFSISQIITDAENAYQDTSRDNCPRKPLTPLPLDRANVAEAAACEELPLSPLDPLPAIAAEVRPKKHFDGPFPKPVTKLQLLENQCKRSLE